MRWFDTQKLYILLTIDKIKILRKCDTFSRCVCVCQQVVVCYAMNISKAWFTAKILIFSVSTFPYCALSLFPELHAILAPDCLLYLGWLRPWSQRERERVAVACADFPHCIKSWREFNLIFRLSGRPRLCPCELESWNTGPRPTPFRQPGAVLFCFWDGSNFSK